MDNSKNKESKEKAFLILGVLCVLAGLFSLGVSLYKGNSIPTTVPVMLVMSSIMFMMWGNEKKKAKEHNAPAETEDK